MVIVWRIRGKIIRSVLCNIMRLFVIVMKTISREFRVALPWELLYADDLVVIAETEENLIKRLNEWKNNVENRGMKVKR